MPYRLHCRLAFPLLLAVALVASGCGPDKPFKAYVGPDRPLSEIAVVKRGRHTYAHALDGKTLQPSPTGDLHLPPGPHRLEVGIAKPLPNGTEYSVNYFTLRHDFEAGKTYRYDGRIMNVPGKGMSNDYAEVQLVEEPGEIFLAKADFNFIEPPVPAADEGATIYGQAVSPDGMNATGRNVYLCHDTPQLRRWLRKQRGLWGRTFPDGLKGSQQRRMIADVQAGYGQGFFDFQDVPPGKYLLIFSGILRNYVGVVEVGEDDRRVLSVMVKREISDQ